MRKSSIKELFHTVVNVLFAELLELVGYELNLSSYDNLHACLAWADNAGNTCGFDLLLIYESLILYLQTETCDAVVDGSYVGWAAKSLKDNGGYLCVIVVGEAYGLLALCIVVLASRSL